MKAFHVIAGVPRAGSTLLCNILNQNPALLASSTSFIPEILGAVSHRLSNSAEVQSALNADPAAEDRLTLMAKAIVESWYEEAGDNDRTVFDKSRGWPIHSLLLKAMFPGAKILACVRDLRAVFGSVEKQHRKHPILDAATNAAEKSILGRAGLMLGPEGMIGMPALAMVEVMNRSPKDVLPIHFDSFTRDPKAKIEEVYDFLNLPPFKHDFENVINTAIDLDVLYLNKFPHKGEGKVTKQDRNEWKEFVPDEIAAQIFNSYPGYNKLFGFQ